jgi:hypothetical protein
MKATLITVFAFIVAFYFLCGIVVVQPIGAIPDGTTLIYFRTGTGLPFLTSPDGLLLDNGSEVSLLGRAVSAAAIVKLTDGRRIVNLPYSRQLYLWSTGGKDFDR